MHSLATRRTVSRVPPRTSTGCSEYLCEILRRMVCACMHCLGPIYELMLTDDAKPRMTIDPPEILAVSSASANVLVR